MIDCLRDEDQKEGKDSNRATARNQRAAKQWRADLVRRDVPEGGGAHKGGSFRRAGVT